MGARSRFCTADGAVNSPIFGQRTSADTALSALRGAAQMPARVSPLEGPGAAPAPLAMSQCVRVSLVVILIKAQHVLKLRVID